MKSSAILLLMLPRYSCCGSRSFKVFYVWIISTCCVFFLLQMAATVPTIFIELLHYGSELEDIGLYFQKNKNIQSALIPEMYHCIWHENQRAVCSALVPSPQQMTRWCMLWKISRNPWQESTCSVQPTNVSSVPRFDKLKECVTSEKADLISLTTSTKSPYLQDFTAGIV